MAQPQRGGAVAGEAGTAALAFDVIRIRMLGCRAR